LSFRGDYAVVSQFASEDKSLLLLGDGVIGPRETVHVPVLDDVDDAPFTGDYVLRTRHAWTVVKDFVRHGVAEDLGEWQLL
jgi:hypothetical protein